MKNNKQDAERLAKAHWRALTLRATLGAYAQNLTGLKAETWEKLWKYAGIKVVVNFVGFLWNISVIILASFFNDYYYI